MYALMSDLEVLLRSHYMSRKEGHMPPECHPCGAGLVPCNTDSGPALHDSLGPVVFINLDIAEGGWPLMVC